MFQGSFKDVSRKIQEYHKKFQWCFKNLSIKFLWQFCCSMNLIAATQAEGGLVGKGTAKELTMVCCCPTFKIVSPKEGQAGAFWCHELLCSMERRNKVKKKWHRAHFMQDWYCNVFNIMNGSNQTKLNTFAIYSLTWQNSAPFHPLLWWVFMTYQGVIGLQKHRSTKSKLQLLNP